MSRLIFSAIASVDGYTADTSGSFDWAAPDEEVHAFVNDRERTVGTFLYGRRMYETMAVWQELPEVVADFARLWKDADKIVYSSSLTGVSTPRTRLESLFDADAVRDLVASSERDVSIGGPTLAAAAFRAGIVDDVELFLVPISVGGGTPALPTDVVVPLHLEEERRFASGTVYLRYTVTR